MGLIPQFSRLSRRRILAGVVIIVITVVAFTFVVIPTINPGSQFLDVVGYIDLDPRNPAPLIYRKPNLNNSHGWSITEYHWRHGPFIDWSQVDLFLTSLEYHNVSAFLCDSYQTHPDDTVFVWFVWFQKGDTEFEFLYPSRVWY